MTLLCYQCVGAAESKLPEVVVLFRFLIAVLKDFQETPFFPMSEKTVASTNATRERL